MSPSRPTIFPFLPISSPLPRERERSSSQHPRPQIHTNIRVVLHAMPYRTLVRSPSPAINRSISPSNLGNHHKTPFHILQKHALSSPTPPARSAQPSIYPSNPLPASLPFLSLHITLSHVRSSDLPPTNQPINQPTFSFFRGSSSSTLHRRRRRRRVVESEAKPS